MQSDRTPSPLDVRQQLGILHRCDTFTSSGRLLALLTHLIEETLAGRGGNLREAAIGNAVYRRDPPYDPRIDSTVRVEARRLRKKLAQYFQNEGAADPVRVTIPVGSYNPHFAFNSRAEDPQASENAHPMLFEKGKGASVAILPFLSLSRDANTRDFADGLTDELIYAFGKEPGIRVQSRSASFTFSDRVQPISSVAAELGVDVVLQGTVREQNQSIRVTVELSDGDGFVVSSDRFDGSSRDRLQLQENIATTLLSRLRIDTSAMRAHKLGPGPQAVEGHAKVYRARRLVDKQTPAMLMQALGIFQDLEATLPSYARGHAGIADCYCDLFRIGMIDRATAYENARPAADLALKLDPNSADALTASATVSAWIERDREKAADTFEAALSIGGNSRSARIYGVFLTILGLHEEAEHLFAAARQLEPFSQQQDIAEAVSRFQSRRFEAFRDDQVLEQSVAPLEATFHTALAKFFNNDLDGARSLAEGLRGNTASHPQLVTARDEMEAWLGAPEAARRTLSTLEARGSYYARATLAASVGDAELTLSMLARAVTAQELASVWIRSDPRFDWIRTSPDFRSLLLELDSQRAS
jgi:TolB-like protein/Tfp pilus assembly protein PilF